MIRGIGTDIIEISRIKNSMENPRFLEKNFTLSENEYFVKKRMNPQTVAVAFCAKEAFSKALGTGISGFSHKDIEVLHNESGAPYIKLYNNAKELCADKNIHLSLSHSKNYATAVVVIEEGI